MPFQPYLNFGGNCREAFTEYQNIFGGELTLLSMGDMPGGGADVPADQKDLVMHAALVLNETDVLMASDAPQGEFKGISDVWVNYAACDNADAERVFEALSKGGEVTMPLAETFWSKAFGMCKDRFGVLWMVNGEAVEQPV